MELFPRHFLATPEINVVSDGKGDSFLEGTIVATYETGYLLWHRMSNAMNNYPKRRIYRPWSFNCNCFTHTILVDIGMKYFIYEPDNVWLKQATGWFSIYEH